MAQQLLETLSKAVVYLPGTDNVTTNRKLWDSYAREWRDQPAWLEKMAKSVGETPSLLGTEWSTTAALDFVWGKYVMPFLRRDSRVLEIGPGGGRLTTRVLSHLGPQGSLVCCDISEGMLGQCKAAVQAQGLDSACSLTFVHVPEGEEAGMDLSVLTPYAPFDFILCFDVLVHVSVKPQWAYLARMGRGQGQGGWLAQGGKAFISTANILAPKGWERFAAQRKETAGGFCWSSPDLVDQLVKQAGLVHVLRSWPPRAQEGQEGEGEGNMYEERDYLLVVERAPGT